MTLNSDASLKALNKINLLRKKIDDLDARLIKLLKKRFGIVQEIGILKKNTELPVFQKSRWTELMRDRIKQTTGADGKRTLSSLFIRDLFTLIHSESLDLQEKLRKSKVHKRHQNEKSKNGMESKQLEIPPRRTTTGISRSRSA